MIEIKIIKDSICKGKRLTTIELRYPRTLLNRITEDSDIKSNSSALNKDELIYPEYVEILNQIKAKKSWLEAVDSMLEYTQELISQGISKSTANKILEPWTDVRTVATSDCWSSFLSWSNVHYNYSEEFYELTEAIRKEYSKSTPTELYGGDWHLPYINSNERHSNDINTLIRTSVARCSRVSFSAIKKQEVSDLDLFDRLDSRRSFPEDVLCHVCRSHGAEVNTTSGFKGFNTFKMFYKNGIKFK